MNVKSSGKSAFKIILSIAIVAVLAVVSVWAFSIWDLLKADKQVSTPAAPAAAVAEPKLAEADPHPGVLAVPEPIEYADVEHLLSTLNGEQQAAIVGDEERFQQLLRNEGDMRSMVKAAIDNNMLNNAQLRFMFKRAAERVLVEAYLNQLVRLNAEPGFPSDEQVEEFYRNNKERFNIPQRVHISQIFWALPRDAAPEAAAAIEKTARQVVRDLRGGKIDFEAAAVKYSEHQASKAMGGYMGLVKVTDLLPEVRASVMSMKIGAISDPIRTDTGYHIIKRGSSVPAQEIPLEQARPQARQLLLNEYTAKMRAALVEKARETYPYAVDQATAEQWREQLEKRRAQQQAAAE